MKPLGAGFQWLLGALAAALCACATPPSSRPPGSAMTDAGMGLTGAAVQPAPQGWWNELGDAQLDHLIEDALRDNPGLAQAQAAAAHAAQLPAMKLSAGETRLKIPSSFPPAIAGGQTVWAGDLGGVLSWDLDLWGEHADEAAQARALADAAELDIDDARLLLAAALVQSYIDLYRSYALADIADLTEAQRANILNITRERVAAGLDTRVELREAEGALPQARLARTQAQLAESLAIHQLAALGGRGADAYAAIGRPQLNLEAALPLPAQD